jgi:MFS family permease/quinol monooxygenase YgiN
VTTSGDTHAGAPSALAPLRDPRFRLSWLAFLAAQVVIWSQTVGAVDVITAQSGSAAVVAAIQTAISLPGVALALLAGAVADVFDRRRLVIGATLAMLVAMAALAALTSAGAASPAVVLAMTAALGAGLATFLPAFSAAVPDIVPRAMLAPAVAITNVSVNVARAVGPAAAGLVLAVAGADVLFWLLTGVLALVVVALAASAPSVVPEHPERIAHAVRAGARYARFSAPLRAVLVRTALFILLGSALWALLPVVAVERLDLAASDFGLLLACVGGGAVAGASLLPRLQARLSGEAIVAGGGVAVGAALVALSLVTHPVVAAAVLVLVGVAWIAVLTALLTTAQLIAPAWVRGRALASWLLAYQAGFAVGGVLWGVIADASLQAALVVAAAGLALAGVIGRLLPMPAVGEEVLEPARSWEDPVVVADIAEDSGPVLVTVDYEVGAEHAADFVAAMEELSAIRRRDGALRWELYQDVEEPERFVETFTAATWGEHLRHHERGTQLDVPLEQRALGFARQYSVRHLVGATGREHASRRAR